MAADTNYELQFVDAITNLLQGRLITYSDGTKDVFNRVHFVRYPDDVFNNTCVVLVPKGPDFTTERIGDKSRLSEREIGIHLAVYIFHDGVDIEVVMRHISDLTLQVSKLLMETRRLGGTEHVMIGKCEYDWAAAEDADSPGNPMAVTSVVEIPVLGVFSTYRR